MALHFRSTRGERDLNSSPARSQTYRLDSQSALRSKLQPASDGLDVKRRQFGPILHFTFCIA